MPKLNTLHKLERIREKISQLEQGVELEARDINSLLTLEQQKSLKDAWSEQQRLRKVIKPIQLSVYEKLHKQLSLLYGKCLKTTATTTVNCASVYALQTNFIVAAKLAHAELSAVLKNDSGLAVWLDRDNATQLVDVELFSDPTHVFNSNITQIKKIYAQLPILVTSRSTERLVSEQERFGWLTIRELRLVAYNEALATIYIGLDEELDKLQNQREVSASRVYLDAYFSVKSESRSAKSVANAALQRNGFKRLDRVTSRNINTRDKEVREMEQQLRTNFERDMTDEEREQLEMSRAFDKASKRSS